MVSTGRLTTRPANTTRPPAGARTGIPSRAARSSPRWPASQRCAGGSKPLRRSGSGSSGQPHGGMYRTAPGDAPPKGPGEEPYTAPGSIPDDAPADRSAAWVGGTAAGEEVSAVKKGSAVKEGSAAASSRAASRRINGMCISRVSARGTSATLDNGTQVGPGGSGSGCGGRAVDRPQAGTAALRGCSTLYGAACCAMGPARTFFIHRGPGAWASAGPVFGQHPPVPHPPAQESDYAYPNYPRPGGASPTVRQRRQGKRAGVRKDHG